MLGGARGRRNRSRDRHSSEAATYHRGGSVPDFRPTLAGPKERPTAGLRPSLSGVDAPPDALNRTAPEPPVSTAEWAHGSRTARESAAGHRGAPDRLTQLRELRWRGGVGLDSGGIGLDRDAPALRDVRQRERIYRRSLVCADALAAALAALLAIDVIGGYALRPLYLLVVPLIVLAAKVGGLYDKDELVIDHSTLNELPRLLNLATMFALLVWLGRHYVVVGAPTTMDLLAAVGAARRPAWSSARSVARAIARRVAPVERCLLVGRRERLRAARAEVPRLSARRRSSASSRPTEIANDHVEAARDRRAATTSIASSSTPTTRARRRRSRSSAPRTRPACRSACCRACSARSAARSSSTTSAAWC